MIEAKVIADSISPTGNRLITVESRFPRYILAEVNTYRMLSKSAQSSRAIPIARRIEEVRDNPVIPVSWGKNQRGMVAETELDVYSQIEAESVWREAAKAAADYATYLAELKLHKQVASRVLEPFLWQTNVMAGTSEAWLNMFHQRIHPDAQPEFQVLATKILEAMDESTPLYVDYGEWHLPYITNDERDTWDVRYLQQASVARMARTSYGNQGGFDIEKDLELESRLFNAEPKHYAPYEGPATPAYPGHLPLGNYNGWAQLRHRI